MSPIKQVVLLALPTSAIFFFHELYPSFPLFPQLLALLSILTTLSLKKTPILTVSLASTFITLLILQTGNLRSPVFFLWYFLLISLALLVHPLVSTVYTLIVITLFTQTVASWQSFLQLASLLGIAPLIWLVGKQQQLLTKTEENETREQSDIRFWLTLKFKTVVEQNMELIRELNNSKLTVLQQQFIEQLRFNHERLLRSKDQLLKTLSKNNSSE